MSAVLTISQAQSCLKAALADQVTALGGVVVAAQETGASEDTIRRRLAGTHRWTDDEIGALYAAAHRRTGGSLVQDRMGQLLAGSLVTAGDGRRALGDVSAALTAVLDEAAAMAAAMASGDIDVDEARAILAKIPGVVEKLMLMQVDLIALIREG